jgi:hypothetical protein
VRAEGHQGTHAVIETIDLEDNAAGVLEVLVTVRTEDGGDLRLEPRHIEAIESGQR